MNNELYLAHHGILGQRWGIRRYQNKDGTLTPEGKQRLSDKLINPFDAYVNLDKNNSARDQEDLKKKGIITGDSSGKDVIKKGATLGRYSNTQNESGEGRKYMYVTDLDKDSYKNHASEGALGFSSYDEIYDYEFEAKHDIQIASGAEVANYLIDKYGDDSIKSKYKEFEELDLRNKINTVTALKRSTNKVDRALGNYAGNLRRDVNTFMRKLSGDGIMKQAIADFSKKGYGGIVDAEDWTGGFGYPVILFDTYKDVKINSITKI